MCSLLTIRITSSGGALELIYQGPEATLQPLIYINHTNISSIYIALYKLGNELQMKVSSTKLQRRIRQRKAKKAKMEIRKNLKKIRQNQIDREFKSSIAIHNLEKRLRSVTAAKLGLELKEIPHLKQQLEKQDYQGHDKSTSKWSVLTVL